MVKVETPAGKPPADVLAEVGFETPGPVHNKVVLAVMVMGVVNSGDTGTWKIEAEAAVQELSLIIELIAPDAYEMDVGEPQTDVRFEKVIFALVKAPTSAPIQS
jgi:hypothetical protein